MSTLLIAALVYEGTNQASQIMHRDPWRCSPDRNSPIHSMLFGLSRPGAQKYFAQPVGQIIAIILSPSHPGEGRIAIVTNARRDVVDAGASARRWLQGRLLVSGTVRARRTTLSVRQNRVVLTSVAGAKLRGGKVSPTGLISLDPPTTVTRRIRRRGEHGISRKAIVQGK